jgi:L-ribulose-5-phosphate 3-epimerase
MPRIAIMQGRLLPPEIPRFQCFPRGRWSQEFAHAAAVGLDAIEWIYDLYGADVNPLATDEGIAAMRSLSDHHGVAVVSVCADYFLDRPFVTADTLEFAELRGHLIWLLARCRMAGIGRVVLPFVDVSRIRGVDDAGRVIRLLAGVLPYAAASGVELHLETALEPRRFAELLAALPHPLLKVNYDSGNSASLGYIVQDELAAYGSRIGGVHIKDRTRGGGTVPLGSGNADIPALLAGLRELKYAGDYVLQVARDLAGEELVWALANRQHLVHQLQQAAAPVFSGSAP